MVVRSWRSVLWGDHVIDGEGNAGTSSRRQAAIVCELRKPLVQDKYSVKAKAQQLMYGFMGYILYFDRGYNLEYNISIDLSLEVWNSLNVIAKCAPTPRLPAQLHVTSQDYIRDGPQREPDNGCAR